MKKTVAVSGGFDPYHPGHVDYFEAASKLGDKLIVILNSDDFLKIKKGYVFMPFRERKRILKSVRYVDRVVAAIDEDQSVCETLRKIKPDIFAKGGDRTLDNIPERQVCEELNIKMVFGVGGTEKKQSSSWLINKIKKPS